MDSFGTIRVETDRARIGERIDDAGERDNPTLPPPRVRP
jgi:hypothetical protein